MSDKKVEIKLDEEGRLTLLLPGFMNASRAVTLRTAEAGETLQRILRALDEDKTEIGLDGAPTLAQVRHWERHTIWADERCRFCLAEGRIKPSKQRFHKTTVVEKRSDGIEIRRIATGKSGPRKLRSAKSLRDLGFE